MTNHEHSQTAGAALDALPDATRAWWTSVLTGQVEGSHPVHGTNLSARVEGDTLVVSGAVATEADRAEIAAETEHLIGHGISTVRNELKVEPEVTDESGLLAQTLIAEFENAELAGLAQAYLESHVHVQEQLIHVIDPANRERGVEELRALLPEAYWEDAGNVLDTGHALLVITVDETEAFKARELLDEDTRSMQTLVLPPEAAANTASAQRSLDKVVRDMDTNEHIP